MCAIIAGIVVLGVSLRLEDPLTDRVIPAEDPYNHMALVREHVRDGSLDALHTGGTVYPPGMHAYLAAVWGITGLELYDIFLLGPAFLGGLGIVGVALLAARLDGFAAAVVSAMAVAVAPETIFRTAMMSPTALDLAIVPFLMLALVEILRGRLAWLAVAVPIATFLIASHPWVLVLLCGAAATFVLLAVMAPWPSRRRVPISPHGFTLAGGLLGATLAIATYVHGGFSVLFTLPPYLDLGWVVLAILGLSSVPMIILWRKPEWLQRALQPSRKTVPLVWRIAAVAVLLAGLVAVTIPAFKIGMPENVNLPRMLGWPILILAAGGFVALPFVRGPLSYLATSLAGSTYLFVIYNPLQSPFWSHRTAVYFGIGAALLAGVAAAGVARAIARMLIAREATRKASPRGASALGWMVPMASVAVALSFGVTVLGASPVSYEGGWYRLYSDCEMEAFQGLADFAAEDANAVIVTGSWQPKLVLAALTPDASRVWAKESFFLSEDDRYQDLAHWKKTGAQVFVVVDTYARANFDTSERSFLNADPWKPWVSACQGSGGFDAPQLTVHTLREVDA